MITLCVSSCVKYCASVLFCCARQVYLVYKLLLLLLVGVIAGATLMLC